MPPLASDLALNAYTLIHTRHTSYRGVAKRRKEANGSFNFTFRYIHDVLSLNNCKFSQFLDPIFHIELEQMRLHIES